MKCRPVESESSQQDPLRVRENWATGLFGDYHAENHAHSRLDAGGGAKGSHLVQNDGGELLQPNRTLCESFSEHAFELKPASLGAFHPASDKRSGASHL